MRSLAYLTYSPLGFIAHDTVLTGVGELINKECQVDYEDLTFILLEAGLGTWFSQKICVTCVALKTNF